MKKIISLCLCLLAASAINLSANPDLKDLFGKISAGSDSTSNSGLGALGSLVSGLISNSDVSVASMAGTWKYSAPAICFKSDNLLKKAGGAAAATTIENKIAPYYKTAGMDKLSLEVKADSTFTMQFGRGSLKGSITKDQDGDIVFQFKALGKVNVGSMKTYVTMSGSSDMSLTFDVSKLISIIKAVGSISGNSSIKSISTLLESYDGIYAGFKLKKQ